MVIIITLLSTVLAFAQVEEEPLIPESIRNNTFYLESIRLTEQARESFDAFRFDESARYAEEAVIQAELSNRHVANQLVGEARRLLIFADSEDIETRFPNEYIEGKEFYEASIEAIESEEWGVAISTAIRSIEIFSRFETGRRAPLPRYYTVRTWRTHRDCFWTIAGRPGVFGDPWRWRELYEANKDRLPNPNNPNFIEPGFVVEIPSTRGEVRQGMWDPNRTYE